MRSLAFAAGLTENPAIFQTEAASASVESHSLRSKRFLNSVSVFDGVVFFRTIA